MSCSTRQTEVAVRASEFNGREEALSLLQVSVQTIEIGNVRKEKRASKNGMPSGNRQYFDVVSR